MQADVIDKSTGKITQIPGNSIDLSSPSIVRLDIDRSQIANLERQGNDLIVHLTSGEAIRVSNFYVQANGALSDLVVREGDHLWLADTGAAGPAHFSALHRIDELLLGTEVAAEGGGGGALLPVLLGGGALAGGAAALAGGGGGSSGSGGSTPPPAADTTPPIAPTATVSGNGANVTGTGEAGATVQVRDASGTLLGSGTVAANGNYSVTLNQPQANGQTVSVTQTDPAGNISPITTAHAPDTTAPSVPTGTIDADGTVVTGTGEPGATVTIRNEADTIIGTGTVDAQGHYAVTLTAAQNNGGMLAVAQTDTAGNASNTLDLAAPDLIPPSAPTATMDPQNLTISGSAEAGATVTVMDNSDGTMLGGTVADADGTYTISLALRVFNGRAIRVVQTDPSGNDSTATVLIAPDLAIPPTPTATVAADGSAVSGTAKPGATVSVFDRDDGSTIGTAVVAADGTYTVPLAPGTSDGGALEVSQTDPSGNVSDTVVVITPDLVAPTAPTATLSADGTSVTGTGEPGATVTVTAAGGASLGTAIVNGDGSYFVPLAEPQANGGTLSVTQADAAGNDSQAVTIAVPDTTAPAAPVASVSADGTSVTGSGEPGATVTVRDAASLPLGSGTVAADGSFAITLTTPQANGQQLQVSQTDTTGNGSPSATVTAPDITAPLGLTAAVHDGGTVVTGTGEPGATVTVRDAGGSVIGTATVAKGGDYAVALTPAQTNGETLQVVQIDGASNSSLPVTAVAPDITAPAAPLGTVSADGTSLSGSGEAGATLTVRDASGTTLGTVVVAADGSYTLSLAPPQANGGLLQLTQSDAAGNLSATTSVPAPDITPPLGLTAAVNGSGTIVSGTGEAGATVTVRDPLGAAIGSAVVAANGGYSVVLTTPQANGELLQVTQADPAGNPSGPVPAQAPDITAPALPTATVALDGASVSGSGEPGATLTVRDPLGTVIGTTTVAGDGSYTVTLTAPQTNGETLSVRQADPAGNASADVPATAPDITAPLGLTAAVHDGGTVVSGSGEPGATVTVRDPLGTAIGTAVVAANGSYSVVLTVPQTNGELLQVSQADAAGNPSTPVPAQAPDLTAPALPTATVSPDGTTVTGAGEPGATLTVRSPAGSVLGTTIVAGDGSYTVTLSIAQTNGETLSVRQADPAGNASADVPAIAPDITAPIGLTATVNGDGTIVSGTGEAGATVTVRDPLGTAIGTAQVAANGSYSVVLTTPQANGQLLQVQQVDGAANPSTQVPALAPDITPPAVPTATVAPDGTSVSGTGEAGATLTVRDPLGNVIGTTTVLGNGTYTVSLTTPQANGQLLSVGQADLAGNASPAVSATAPDITAPVGLTAVVSGDGTIVSGTGEVGATVTVRDPLGTAIGTTQVAANGSYSVVLTTPQANGQLLQVTQVDGAANPSAPVPAQAPDITPPAVPTATVDGTGTSVSGTGEAGATLTVRDPLGNVVGTTTVLGNGTYTVTLTTPQANGQLLSVSQADIAGNVSPTIPALAPDITAPTGLTATVNGTGTIVSGTGEAGATVTVRDPLGTAIGTATVGANGAYAVVLTTPQANGELLQVTQVDGAANPSVPVPALAPDITAPTAPGFTVSPDGTTVSGSGEPGATVTITTAGGAIVGSGPVAGNGSFTIILTTPQANGGTLSATQADVAGNVSLPGTAPAPDITPPNLPAASLDATGAVVTGTGEPGATVTITDPFATVIGTATVSAAGTFSITLSVPQINNQILSVVQTDPAGNPSPALPLTAPDLTAPGAPAGIVAADGASISGVGEPGATLIITDPQGTPIGSVTVTGGGTFTTALVPPQINGELLVLVQTDLAGNASLPGNATAPDLVLNDSPGAPTATVAADGFTVFGTGDAGNTISVTSADGTVLGTTTVTPGGTYIVILTTPQTNGELLHVVQIDAEGDLSPPTNTMAPDLTPPALPVASIDASGTTVTGTGEAGATVRVVNGVGTVLGTAIVDANGNYAVTLSTPQTNGQALTVIQADAAANDSPAAPITAPDITAPLAPTASVAADGLTVSGTGESGATITIRDPLGATVGTTTVTPGGTYIATLTTPQTNGQVLTAVQTDGAGNASLSVNATAPDLTPPAAPTASVDASGQIVSGTGEAGATVTVRNALGVPIGTANVAANGGYSVTLATPQTNGQQLQVVQSDAAGNLSPQTPATAPDTTAPLAPTGTVSPDGSAVTGFGEPGATITIRDAGGTAIGTALVAGNGSFTAALTPAQANGQALTLGQADPAGNLSPTIPLTAPDITAPNAPSATVSADGAVVSGTGEPGATVTVRDALGVPLGTALVAANGSYAVPLLTPQANAQPLQVTQADGAGNISPATPVTSPDYTAPLAPAGTVSPDGATVTGTGEPGATITVRDAGGTAIGTALVAGNGSFTATLTPAQTNGQALTLGQTDPAGNLSPNVPLTAPDTTPPAAPAATVSGDGTLVTGTGEPGATVTVRDAGGTALGTALVGTTGGYTVVLTTPQLNGQALQVTQSDSAGNVSPAAPAAAPDLTAPLAPTGTVAPGGASVTGTGEPGATITIRDAGGTAIGTALVAGNGSFTATLTPAQTNGQLLSLSQSDPAGNLSPNVPLTAPDTTPPTAPSATVSGAGTVVSGIGEPGATVTVRDAGGTALGTGLVGANGAYAVALSTPQLNGQALQVTQADVAGNVSPVTPAAAPDITAPLAPAGAVAPNGATVTGTGEPGATVTIRDAGGTAIGTALVAGNGSFTATLTPAQTNGQVLSISQADPAGNLSPSAAATAPDLTAPTAPSATVSGAGTVVSGTGEPGATVTVRDPSGVPLGTALVAANGSYAVALTTPQGNGQTLQVTQSDPAGNVSPATPALAPDFTAPAAPSGTVNANGTAVTGIGEPGATVHIRNGAGTEIGTAVVAANGSYTATLTTPQANGETVSVTQSDPTGNLSPAATITAPDITPPAAPNASINGAGTAVTGTGEAGATVEVRNAGGTLLGSTTVAANGSFAVSLSAAQTAGQALSVTARDPAGNLSSAVPLTAPYDISAFDNNASAAVHLLPVVTNQNLGSANYVALVSLGLLNLDAQVLSTPSVQFTVAPGHSLNATFTYDALLSIGVLSGYAVVVQRFNGTNWVAVDGNGTSSLLQLSLLNGDLVSNSTLPPGQYRAFVTFDGALGVGLLGGLNVTGADSDFTDVASAQAIAHAGNVITDPGPGGAVDIVSPQTQVQSVTFNGVTTTVAAGGTTIQGSWGTLLINQNGSYTYTPSASAAAIGHTDSFTYTLIDRSDGELESATLTMTIGSPDITGAPVAVNDAAIATATFANVVTTTPAAIDSSFATPTALIITGAQTGTVHDSFTVGANSSANVTLSAIQSSGLSVLPTYTITVTNSAGTVVGTITQTAVANLGLGTGVALTLSGLPAGNYNYTVSSTNILGTGYGTNVYVGQVVTHLDQHTLTGSTTVQGELLSNDTLGTSFVGVRVQSGGSFIEVGETPITIVGAHGTLTVNETGHYSYTPSATLAYSGTDPIDSFTYQVLQPNGTVATARLDVTVDINNGVTPTLMVLETHSLADAVPLTTLVAGPVAEEHGTAITAEHGPTTFGLLDGQDTVEDLLGQFLHDRQQTIEVSSTPTVISEGHASPDISAAPVPSDPLHYLVSPNDLDQDRHQLTHVV